MSNTQKSKIVNFLGRVKICFSDVFAFLPLSGDKEGWATNIKVKSVIFFRTGHLDFMIFQAFSRIFLVNPSPLTPFKGGSGLQLRDEIARMVF